MIRLRLKEEYLDEWFFNLPASWQQTIANIYIDEQMAKAQTYEKFDDDLADWWDSLSYDEKWEFYMKNK